MSPNASRSPALPREERERRVLDTAAELFYARGVHEVGMDELVSATGFGKATVYRLFPTKDALVGAYLERRARTILELVDRDIAEREPADAVLAIFAANVLHPAMLLSAFRESPSSWREPLGLLAQKRICIIGRIETAATLIALQVRTQ